MHFIFLMTTMKMKNGNIVGLYLAAVVAVVLNDNKST